MPSAKRPRAPTATRRAVWGDFQTPVELARQVCRRLSGSGLEPASLVEPTCGEGAFLVAALEAFDSLRCAVGLDVNPQHLVAARKKVAETTHQATARVEEANFFITDWAAIFDTLPQPLLVLGNPPWVTNSELGALGGQNLPAKSNFQGRRGLAARTGASNFDISEWMLLRLLEALAGRSATLAMLVKTAVARRVLAHAWKHDWPVAADLFAIDAPRHFQAAVSASLLVCRLAPDAPADVNLRKAGCFTGLDSAEPSATLGYEDGRLLSDAATYRRFRHLAVEGDRPAGETWRSGVKHDAAGVMELNFADGRLWNGLGESVDVEDECLFPLVKGSELARGLSPGFPFARRLLVPQRSPGEDPQALRASAPRAWAYLSAHAAIFERRASSIYRGRPPFSIFGVGPYTFSPAKVAIAGFARSLEFQPLGPVGGRPVVFDDTCSFLPCESLAEAQRQTEVLHTPAARGFLESQIFWDAKRPITVDLLRRIALRPR